MVYKEEDESVTRIVVDNKGSVQDHNVYLWKEGYEACKGMFHALVSTGKLAKYKNVRKLARTFDVYELENKDLISSWMRDVWDAWI